MSASYHLIRAVVALTALGWWSVGGGAWAQTPGDSAATAPPGSFEPWQPMHTPGLVSEARARQLGDMSLEALFADALSSGTVAEDYTAVREEIVARPGAEEFLKAKGQVGGVGAARLLIAPSDLAAAGGTTGTVEGTSAAGLGTGGKVSTAGGDCATSGLPSTAGGGLATSGAQPEPLAQVRARVLARAMLSWGRLGDDNAYKTSQLLEKLIEVTQGPVARGLKKSPGGPYEMIMEQVSSGAWLPRLEALDRLDDVPPWAAPGRPTRPAVAGGSQPTTYTFATKSVNGLPFPTGLSPANDVPVLLEMAMKGPTGNLRSQLELVWPGIPILQHGRAIVDGAGYRLWARAWACNRLRWSKESDIVPILANLILADPEPEVRAYAAKGFELRGGDGVEPLLAGLNDENLDVYIMVVRTLDQVTGTDIGNKVNKIEHRAQTCALYRAWWAKNKAEFCRTHKPAAWLGR